MKKAVLFYWVLSLLIPSAGRAQKVYLSTPESLATRPVPEWYDGAKLGIFIHWGLYSVPAWATPTTTPDKVTDWPAFYKNNPYAEWYLNTLRIAGSPTQEHHKITYGADYDYYSFADTLAHKTRNWSADAWADLFSAVGARYVVFTTKHSDGYVMYPSRISHPFFDSRAITSPRDFAGEIAGAVRKKGLKFGVYYSGGLDWSFNRSPVTNLWPDLFQHMPKSVAYTAYADAHFFELIHRYAPDILWNDVNFPENGDMTGIFAEAIHANPDVVMNDRWRRHPELSHFTTPEYVILDTITQQKWETCRGIGYSFGYNQTETSKHLLRSDELINMLIDIVSKNGNLLINVGPKADGSIPENQLAPLRDLGKWLQRNGEGIYGTRPWKRARLTLEDRTEIRFTRKRDTLNVFFLSAPKTRRILIPDCTVAKGAKAVLAGAPGQEIRLVSLPGKVQLELPEKLDGTTAFLVKISGLAN
ncbi:MAG TPA: alpha-L-fucosidase [Chitinophagaceae bacterium]|jgi:alpha-L-fucosidase|nr:alpha-L-fucosidase [Chitinophagaceae bacterium]